MRPGNYIGLKRTARCGIEMEIVGYRNSRDIDVRFADEAVVCHKSLANFRRGEIGHPNNGVIQQKLHKTQKERIGMKKLNSSGYEMEIVAYRRSDDIDVRFPQGAVVHHTNMNSFRKGHIKEPNSEKIGETSISKNGETITLIEYRSNDDVTVRFEDGTEKKTSYCHFKAGAVANPNNPYKPKARTNRLGEEGTANNGKKIKIVAYRTANDIDVQTEEGTILKHLQYDRFKKGQINTTNYALRVGQKKTTRCGLTAEIVSYKDSGKDGVEIEFEDGVRMKMQYSRFVSGEFAHPTLKTKKISIYHGFRCLYAFHDDEKTYYNTENIETGERNIMTPQQMFQKEGRVIQ